MKTNYYFFSVLFLIITVISCSKDDIQNDSYKTGVIEFEYQKSITGNGLITVQDTIIKFTSIGNNLDYEDNYGYSNPSTPWVIMERLNPNDFTNRGIIFFSGTNLNLLDTPYTFSPQDINMDAQLNYVVGEEIIEDSNGQQMIVYNTYSATTFSNNFELTILSKENNRLKGIFEGQIENQDGDILDIKNGMFDIKIVEK